MNLKKKSLIGPKNPYNSHPNTPKNPEKPQFLGKNKVSTSHSHAKSGRKICD